MLVRILFVALILLVGASACGKKGPLYLPAATPAAPAADVASR